MNHVDGRRADPHWILNGIAVHFARGDRAARLRRCIVADDRDLSDLACGANGGKRAERRVVVDAEDAFEVPMRLQNVAGIAARLVARSARIDVGDDRYAGAKLRDRLFKALTRS